MYILSITHNSKLKRTEIETAQREERLKQELDNAKLTYADKLRRKLALKAMLSLLNVCIIPSHVAICVVVKGVCFM